MNLLKEWIIFLKKPELTTPVSLSFKEAILLLLKSIPFYFLFILICTIFFIPLSVFDLIPELPERSLSDVYDLIIIAPFLEELFFRLPLRNFFRNLFFTFALLFYSLTKSFFGIPLTIAISLIIIALPYIPGFINRIEYNVNSRIRRFYPVVFYLVALTFGFLHITNLNNLTTAHYFVSPVIVLYQILIGLFLGFVRVKYNWGIIYSILIHAGFNSIPVLIKLL
jgi:hypothetical protein